jgi:hypothetical protein
MNERIIPAPETISAHEQAAAEITELRRKGIHCHLEESNHQGGHCVDVVMDPEGQVNDVAPAPPQRSYVRRRGP